MGELTLPEDPSDDIKRMLEAAKRSKATESNTEKTPELPNAPFAMNDAEFVDYMQSEGDLPIKNTPQVGEPVYVAATGVSSNNLGPAVAVVDQPYGNENQYRVTFERNGRQYRKIVYIR